MSTIPQKSNIQNNETPENIKQENCEYYSNNSDTEFSVNAENEKAAAEMFKKLNLDTPRPEIDIFESFKTYKKIYNEPIKEIKKEEPKLKINELKTRFENISKEVKEYIQKNNDSQLINKYYDFPKVLEELKIYETKMKTISESDYYKLKYNNINYKNEINTNINRFNNYKQKLFSFIKNEEKSKNKNEVHEILTEVNKDNMNFEKEIGSILDKLSNLENKIGSFDLKSSSVSYCLKKIYDEYNEIFDETKNNKNEILDQLSNILDQLIENKNKTVNISKYDIIIKNLYGILETYDFYYDKMAKLNSRIKAIIKIHEDSDKYTEKVNIINTLINKNKENLKKLSDDYNETFKAFEKIEKIIEEMKFIESKIQKNFI